MTEPLFKDAYSAVKFAFGYEHGQTARPFINKIASGSLATGKGLGGLDGAAQAGMIKDMLRFDARSYAVLCARAAPRYFACSCNAPCCSRKKPNITWKAAINMLADEAKVFLGKGTVSTQQLRRELVLKHYGAGVNIAELSEKLEMHRNTVASHHKTINEALSKIEDRAWRLAEQLLIEAGVVETVEKKAA